jgi:hypothetical protein
MRYEIVLFFIVLYLYVSVWFRVILLGMSVFTVDERFYGRYIRRFLCFVDCVRKNRCFDYYLNTCIR